MTTTIRTSSKNYFNKIQKYIKNKRVFFTSSIENGVYTRPHKYRNQLSHHQNDQTLPPLTKTAGASGSCCLI